jgi:hypothetical protein
VQRSLRAATPSRTLLSTPAAVRQADLLMTAALAFLNLLQAMHAIGATGVELTSVRDFSPLAHGRACRLELTLDRADATSFA